MERVFVDRSQTRGAALLRELSGQDEESTDGLDTDAAVALLDRLLVSAPDVSIRPGDAARLSASDRDRLLARVYRRSFGDRIEMDLECAACAERFSLDFDLAALEEELFANAAAHTPDAEGFFEVAGSARFRLPTARDEVAVAGVPEQSKETALLARCLDGGVAPDTSAVLSAMSTCGPLLSTELGAECPACSHAHEITFDMQGWLLGSILAEAPQRALEIHRLATKYGWGLTEILTLTRRRRRAFAVIIERERAA
jgi:hypothetical protein